MLQLSGDRWADSKDKATLEAEFRDELADILAEVLYIASERGIDMNQAMGEWCKVTPRRSKSERDSMLVMMHV